MSLTLALLKNLDTIGLHPPSGELTFRVVDTEMVVAEINQPIITATPIGVHHGA